jgi:GNAT superfamily N-acetyltransferase
MSNAIYATFSTVNKFDLGKLEQADIMCFDDCWTKEQWEEILKDNSNMVKLVFTSFGLVGFWCAKVTVPANPDAVHDVEIVKIGVMPNHRGQGLSHAILRDIRSWLQTDFVDSSEFNVTMLVPDCLLEPSWPSFIGKWLSHAGFRPAERGRMLVEMPQSFYGVKFQHAVRYIFPRLPGAFGL